MRIARPAKAPTREKERARQAPRIALPRDADGAYVRSGERMVQPTN